MYFSIGAHPAFLCPAYEKEKQAGCYLKLDTNGPLLRNQLDPETGYVQKYDIAVSLKNGLLPVKPELFAQDALIIEGGQAHRVSLLDSQKNPVVSVTFQAPLFGIWAPRRQDVPFVCIEPWYGRCDSEDFSGTMEERPYTNTLEPGAVFRAGYEMEFYQEGAKI